jgi:hypothetical protein
MGGATLTIEDRCRRRSERAFYKAGANYGAQVLVMDVLSNPLEGLTHIMKKRVENVVLLDS